MKNNINLSNKESFQAQEDILNEMCILPIEMANELLKVGKSLKYRGNKSARKLIVKTYEQLN